MEKIIEEKLQRFSTDIMQEAKKKERHQLLLLDKQLNEEYEKQHEAYLNEAYELIQKGLKGVDKQKNERLSKCVMDNRMRLLQMRTQVIEDVFTKAEQRLSVFTQSPDYEALLVDRIKDALQKLDKGKITIYLRPADEPLISMLKVTFPAVRFELESKKIVMIGGCKAYNKTTKVFVDNTFAKALETAKEGFLQKCGIEIGLD